MPTATPWKQRYWIFDLDGTLTLPQHDFSAFRDAHELPHDRPILEAIHALPAQQATFILRALQDWEWSLADQATPQPHAAELLSALQQRNCSMAILTRNRKPIALRTLATIGLQHFFSSELVLGRDEATPKPSPAGVQHLLTYWGAQPEQALLVGDYIFDMQAGHAASVTTVFFNTSGKSNPWADHTIKTLASLM